MTLLSEARISNIAGALLTGGASKRMGSDKSRLEIGGIPAATRIATLLESLFEEVIIVGGDPPSSAPGRRVPDPEGPVSSMRGLATALSAVSAERVLVLATDLPFVTPDLLLGIVAWPEADAVVPRSEGRAHPLCALYRRETVSEVAQNHLATGRFKLSAFLDSLETHYLDDSDLAQLDPDGTALMNVNDPEDLRRARELLLARGEG